MSWRSFLRRHGVTGGASDNDSSYLTGVGIVDPPSSDEPPPVNHHSQSSIDPDDSTPDIILLTHRRVTYPLHFAPYAIDDGLTVGQLRQRAAEQMVADVNHVKLLYKGSLLKEDSVRCKEQGLKQQSQITCVVSQVPAGESASDLSGEESNPPSDAMVTDSDHPRRKSKKVRKKHRKRRERSAGPQPDPNTLSPHVDRRSSPSGRSAAPSPAPSFHGLRTAHEQVQKLVSYFHSSLRPMCEEFIADPPADSKTRTFEHKKLGETVLAQVILKADGIEVDGDEDARGARRALIKEAQAILNQLDQVARE